MQAVPIWLINKTRFTHSIYLTPSTWRFVLRVSFASTAPLEFFSPGFSMVVVGGGANLHMNFLPPINWPLWAFSLIPGECWDIVRYCGSGPLLR